MMMCDVFNPKDAVGWVDSKESRRGDQEGKLSGNLTDDNPRTAARDSR